MTTEEKKVKEPTLVNVLFLTQWRGHAAGALADLTEERSKELIADGVCEATKGMKPAELQSKALAAEEAAAEAKARAKASGKGNAGGGVDLGRLDQLLAGFERSANEQRAAFDKALADIQKSAADEKKALEKKLGELTKQITELKKS